MARVAVIPVLLLLALLSGCGSSDDDPPPAPEADSSPASVYIERGYVPYTVENPDGTLSCDSSVLSSLLVQDGTVSVDGTLVTTTWDESTVTVMFDGPAFAEVAIVNGQVATVLRDTAKTVGFKMDFGAGGDWNSVAPADEVVVCGGGM